MKDGIYFYNELSDWFKERALCKAETIFWLKYDMNASMEQITDIANKYKWIVNGNELQIINK